MAAPDNEALRSLPQIDRVIRALGDEEGPVAASAARNAVEEARAAIVEDASPPSFDTIVERARSLILQQRRARLSPVINATGVLIHTNLGRSPLGEEQLDAVVRSSATYSDLEFDLESNRRSSRHEGVSSLITLLTGAEAGLVTNNNAAAVLVTLAALADGKEVVVSRGELIEIGGQFRIPDVMRWSGARLVEVGTTNRTHLRDFEEAVGPATGAILKVHPSNYRVVGFTSEVMPGRLAELAAETDVPFLFDIGSGLLEEAPWLGTDEPTVAGALAAGASVVTFSGDKLLGGPQAGIVVGHQRFVSRIARHPLMRVVRPDKMTLAALEATLIAYLTGRAADLPLWRLAAAPVDELKHRAEAISAAVTGTAGGDVAAIGSEALMGGGSTPGERMPSWAVAVKHDHRSADDLRHRLTIASPPIVGRVIEDRLLLDLKGVFPDQDDALVAGLRAALA